jgi:hypothetical protein
MIFDIIDKVMLALITFIFIQKNPSKKLFNIPLIYIFIKYGYEILLRLLHNNTILQAYVTINTVHHLASIHICLYYILIDVFSRYMCIPLWLHFFKDHVIYIYIPSIYFYVTVIYNFSWFIPIYYTYKHRNHNYSFPIFVNCLTIFIVNKIM